MVLAKKLAASGSRALGVEVLNHAFDYMLYPLVVLLLGTLRGGVAMTILAVLLNYRLVQIYSKSQYDWYGFEWMKVKAAEQGTGWAGTFLRMGMVPAFVFLSWEDPFKAFILVRGKKGVGCKFGRLDWITFLGANILGNLIWTGMLGSVIEGLKHLFA